METGTIEQTLPGLETMNPQTELDIGRAIALSPQKRLMLFSGRSNPELAQRIAEQLDIELGRVNLKTFPSGETYCRYEESSGSRRSFPGTSTRARTRSRVPVSRSALASSRTCWRPPVPTAC